MVPFSTNIYNLSIIRHKSKRLAQEWGTFKFNKWKNYNFYVWDVLAAFNKEMIRRLENVENLPEEEKSRIFHFIDLVIRDYKAGQAYATK